jgi:hypothetical protein
VPLQDGGRGGLACSGPSMAGARGAAELSGDAEGEARSVAPGEALVVGVAMPMNKAEMLNRL